MISVEALSVQRGARTILQEISFTVKPGELVSLVGPNGAGKTTLLKALIRIVPCFGQVAISGRELKRYSQKDLAKQIAFVAQAELPPAGFSVRDFVAMGRYPHRSLLGGRSREDTEAIDRALEIAGAASLERRSLGSLSAGERQRVFLAGAIAQETPILFLDEPATFLDPDAEEEVYRILAELRRTKEVTILMVTHDLNRAALSSTRILGLKDGRMSFDGTPHELMQPAALHRLFSSSFEFVRHPTDGRTMLLPSAVVPTKGAEQ